MKERKEKI